MSGKVTLPRIRKFSVDVPDQKLAARDPAEFTRRMDTLLLEMTLAVSDLEAAADAWNAMADAIGTVTRRAVEDKLGSMDPDEVRRVSVMYDEWSGDGVKYKKNQVLAWDGELVKVVQAHTSQPDWSPDAAPSLFARFIADGQVVAWVQPTGAHDAYDLGQQVAHNGRLWESDVDANTWEPPTQWTDIGAAD